MKEIKIGRITLSFIFISLGIMIFLKKTIGQNIITDISMLWLIVVMFFGIEIIYSYLYTKENQNFIKKIDIISVALIVIFLIVIKSSEEPKEDIKDKYNDNISEEVILKNNKKIIVEDSGIDIFVEKSMSDRPKIRLEGKYSYGDATEHRNKKNFIIKDNKGKTVKISRDENIKKKINKKNSINDMKYTIEIPEGIEVDIKSRYGSINIEDVKSNISINSSHGNINLDNVNGEIFIKSENGNIALNSLHMIEKDIGIYCDLGDVFMNIPESQMGKFNIITTYGNIYNDLNFDIIESVSTKSINESRKSLNPDLKMRVNNGNIIIRSN